MTVPSSYPGTFVSPGFVINAAYSLEPLVLWDRGDRERMVGSPGHLLMPHLWGQLALGGPIWNKPELPHTSDHKNTTLNRQACLMPSSPTAGVKAGPCCRLPQIRDLRLWEASPLQASCGYLGLWMMPSWAWHSPSFPTTGTPVRGLGLSSSHLLRMGTPLLPSVPSHFCGCHRSTGASEWPCRYIGPLFGSPGL